MSKKNRSKLTKPMSSLATRLQIKFMDWIISSWKSLVVDISVPISNSRRTRSGASSVGNFLALKKNWARWIAKSQSAYRIQAFAMIIKRRTKSSRSSVVASSAYGILLTGHFCEERTTASAPKRWTPTNTWENESPEVVVFKRQWLSRARDAGSVSKVWCEPRTFKER